MMPWPTELGKTLLALLRSRRAPPATAAAVARPDQLAPLGSQPREGLDAAGAAQAPPPRPWSKAELAAMTDRTIASAEASGFNVARVPDELLPVIPPPAYTSAELAQMAQPADRHAQAVNPALMVEVPWNVVAKVGSPGLPPGVTTTQIEGVTYAVDPTPDRAAQSYEIRGGFRWKVYPEGTRAPVIGSMDQALPVNVYPA